MVNLFELYGFPKSLFEKYQIKLYYIYGNQYKSIIFVTKQDLVYIYDLIYSQPFKVPELCYKSIIDFSCGENYMIALSKYGYIYSFGENSYGQLGIIKIINYFTPNLVDNLFKNFITNICCGSFHTLVLTSNGTVYGWGLNTFGQIGDNTVNTKFLPVKINRLKNIKSISCGSSHSLALDEDGVVYGWGNNIKRQLAIKYLDQMNIPIQIVNDKIKKICCGSNHSILLSKYKKLIYFGEIGGVIIEKQTCPNIFFKKIASSSNSDTSIALSENGNFYILGKYRQSNFFQPQMIKTENFFTCFASNGQPFHKPYTIVEEKHLLSKKNNSKNAGIFKMFPDVKLINSGSWGIVYKVNRNSSTFAVKVSAVDNISLNEVKMLQRLQSNYVVKMESAWIEKNYFGKNKNKRVSAIYNELKNNNQKMHKIFNANTKYILHIQMEYCYKTLERIMLDNNIEYEVLNLKKNSRTVYYVASMLFLEIVEAVNFLHSQDPPIIHRDLKPKNILITSGLDGNFLKLGDFGLSTLHQYEGQQHLKQIGTKLYWAPEVANSSTYNTKADIYSLGIILQKIIQYKIEKTSRKFQ